ncbi:EcsC family protein [Umezawaea beigongshangensis]|uniref:EcsC family protein n=1 Tax=Umezawaea beigongshangensis TaxID=2780383 RepID=UPI0018F176E9|nr:EcsC family protein [Umezawaea beigongshangensis]
MQPSRKMSDYDAEAWRALNDRPERTSKQLLPAGLRARLSRTADSAKEKFESLPGAGRFEEMLTDALRGLTDLGARAARASLRRDAVLGAYRKRGHAVESLDDVRRLDLREIDEVRPRLDLGYVTASTVQGAAAGFAVSGGQVIAAGGTAVSAGAAAAPGAALVLGTMAADAAAVLMASHRAVAHVAAYYGYDLDRDDEKLFALGVLGYATASNAGKAQAYLELNKVVRGLAGRQSWMQLEQHVVTRVVQQVYQRLGIRLTKQKLAQAVPVVGVVIGAGLNARLLSRVVDDANHAYRRRFLQEKYGLLPAPVADVADVADTISVAEIVDAEIVDEDRT